jgi:hypothetical protein
MKITTGKLVWEEDDARPPDAESLRSAYLRLTGELLNYEQATLEVDVGDCIFYAMPNGFAVRSSYPGNSAIYEGPIIQNGCDKP